MYNERRVTMKFQHLLIGFYLTSLFLGGCSQTTNNLYRLELERECVECNLEGVNLSKEDLGVKYRIPRSSKPLSVPPFGLEEAKPVNLTRANLTKANFFQADLSGVIFNKADLKQANLSETNLEEAKLQGANLQNANLQKANLQGADLEGANLKGTDLRGVNFKETNLTDIITDDTTIWYDTNPK